MRTKSIYFGAALFLVMSFIPAYSQDYYWNRGEKVFVKRSDHRNFHLFSNTDKTTRDVKIRSTKVFNKELNWAFGNFRDFEKDDFVEYVSPAVINSSGDTLNFSNLFYVRLNDKKDIEILEKMAKEHNVDILGSNKFMPLWYTLSCSKKSTGNALEMANLFYESKLFSAIEVDYLIPHEFNGCAADALYGQQWSLTNTGQNGGTPGIDINYCAAKAITTGSPDIIVAVVDGGIDPNHPDITNIHYSYNAETGQSPAPPNAFNDHGTQVGGIIGAAHNNIGIAGIAPNCKLMSISKNRFPNPDQAQKTADGINWAWRNGASVINNSWGGSNYNNWGTGYLIGDALDSALIRGRNGKGTVVVFGSGNEGADTVIYLASWRPEIITVGAIEPNGQRWISSNYGVALDVVAPGVNIFTTCAHGPYSQVSGTSFAAPHVAGVAALILSDNPNLTQRQVANIIKSTAQKVRQDLYTYSTVAGRPGTWNIEMGHGLVDAGAAVGCLRNIHNHVISNTRTYQNCATYVKNTTITSTGRLVLSATENVTIGPGFTVQPGGSLTITVP